MPTREMRYPTFEVEDAGINGVKLTFRIKGSSLGSVEIYLDDETAEFLAGEIGELLDGAFTPTKDHR